ncbi:MAG: PAS domain S-box protein [Phycisphaerae bacterium]|nr:PAS domain S-box protein [Phycisphaerae bacterium]
MIHAPQSCILLVEGDPAQRQSLEEILCVHAFKVVSCKNATETLTSLSQDLFDVMVIDLHLPDMAEDLFLREIGPYFKKIPTVVNTGLGSYETAKKALNLGAVAYVDKTDHPDRLIHHVHRAANLGLRRQKQVLEEHLDGLFRLSLDPICIIDLQSLRFVRVNPAFERILGYREAEWLGRPFFCFTHPDDAERTEALIKEKLEQGEKVIDLENRYCCKDGSYRWLNWACQPQSNLKLIYAVGRDVTASMQASISLHIERDRAEMYLDIVSAIIVALDLGQRVILINRKGCDILGAPRDWIMGKKWFDTFVPDIDRERTEQAFCQILKGNVKPAEYVENRIVNAQGQVRLIAWHNMILRDSVGSIIGAIGSGQDITEQRNKEVKLRASEEKYRALVNSLQERVWIIDADSKTSYVNQPMSNMLGYSVDDMMGKYLFDFMDDDAKKLANQKIENRKKGEKAVHEFEFTHKDGRRINTVLDTAPIMDEQGNFKGAIAGVIDVTQLKLTQRQLLNYQERLKSLTSKITLTEERLKQMISRKLHDGICQSLALTRMNLVTLTRDMDDPSLRERLAEITRSLSCILTESRSLTNQLSFPALNVLGLVKATEYWLRDEIQAKYGLCTSFSDDGLEKPLGQDLRAVLFRCIRELLNNIIEHAQARHVTIAICRKGQDVCIQVTDDGIGFDLQSADVTISGYGILSIQESMERLGGCLEIITGKGLGCSVTLKAPLALIVQDDQIGAQPQ